MTITPKKAALCTLVLASALSGTAQAQKREVCEIFKETQQIREFCIVLDEKEREQTYVTYRTGKTIDVFVDSRKEIMSYDDLLTFTTETYEPIDKKERYPQLKCTKREIMLATRGRYGKPNEDKIYITPTFLRSGMPYHSNCEDPTEDHGLWASREGEASSFIKNRYDIPQITGKEFTILDRINREIIENPPDKRKEIKFQKRRIKTIIKRMTGR